jgi:hypothetical protein
MFKPKKHPHLPQIFDYHAFKTRELDALGMTQTLVPDAVRNFSHGFFANRQRHAVPFPLGHDGTICEELNCHTSQPCSMSRHTSTRKPPQL